MEGGKGDRRREGKGEGWKGGYIGGVVVRGGSGRRGRNSLPSLHIELGCALFCPAKQPGRAQDKWLPPCQEERRERENTKSLRCIKWNL